ncbi:MAG: acyl-CoA dehydrogenase family protein [Aeromicrobium sp.]
MTEGEATRPAAGVEETPAEFGRRLQSWVEAHLGPDAGAEADDPIAVTQALYDEGFIGITWPTVYGGRGLGAEYQTEFNRVISPYSDRYDSGSVTVGICAATILDYGSEEQKLRYLPRMLRRDDSWTQLLSEPGAGSDLGGVTTRAVRDGDRWILNGQKVWTSGARESQYAIALVRTDPDVPKYAGVSMIVVPLDAPGVDIRPLTQMTGDAHFNEVFLDDVSVPADSLIGRENDGWAVLGRMLFHERMALSAGTVGGLMARDGFSDLLGVAQRRGVDQVPEVRHTLGEVYLQNKLLEYMGVRMRAAAQSGRETGPIGSIGKIGIAKLARLTAEAGILIGGEATIAWSPDDASSRALSQHLLFFPMTGIAGGTTEIQRNVVAERVLGLPRERRADRDVPFRDLPKNAQKS